jgi:HAD superfamily hydrolase (TIGR01509 family)
MVNLLSFERLTQFVKPGLDRMRAAASVCATSSTGFTRARTVPALASRQLASGLSHLAFRRLDSRPAAGFPPRVRIRGILFDYGGTLDGPASHWLDRFVALYREAGVDRPLADIKAAFYRADDAAYVEPGLAEANLTRLMEFHVGRQLQSLAIERPDLHRHLVARFLALSEAALAASRAVLALLARRFRLGVVSNFYGNVGRILADAGFAPLLTIIVDSSRVGLSKPDPRLYTYAADALGLPAGEVLHVGDSYERDVVAAHRAGLRTAWLAGDHSLPEPTEPVHDLRLRSLDELVAYLDAL